MHTFRSFCFSSLLLFCFYFLYQLFRCSIYLILFNFSRLHEFYDCIYYHCKWICVVVVLLLLFCSEIMATFFANYLSNTPITSFVEMLCFVSIYIAVWIASANVSLSQHFQFVHILMHHPKPSIWFILCSHWTWCSRL